MPSIAIFLLLALMGVSRAFTGNVRGTDGRPIPNALVAHADHPATYAKTRSDGSFTIPGEAGTALTVAALGFETRRRVPAADAPMDIRLQPDPALESSVFHLDFDHLRAGDHYSEPEAMADLHVANAAGLADASPNPDPSSSRAAVDPSVSVSGTGHSFKVRFPRGQLKTSGSGVDLRIPLQGTYKTNAFRASELYVSYWVKFSRNFDFSKCGGKLPSLGGDYARDGSRWKGRIMWRNGGSIQFYPEVAGGEDSFDNDADRFWGSQVREGGSICKDEFTPFLSRDRWHNIELHYRFETPGREDGFFEGWVDGGRGHKLTHSARFGSWRGSDTSDGMTINYFLLSAFLGGSDFAEYSPSEDTHAWFDEVKVSRQRINDYPRWSGTTLAGQRGRIARVSPLPSLIPGGAWPGFPVRGQGWLLRADGRAVADEWPGGKGRAILDGRLQGPGSR